MDPILGARNHFAPFLSCNHQWLAVCLWTFGCRRREARPLLAPATRREKTVDVQGKGERALLAASPGSRQTPVVLTQLREAGRGTDAGTPDRIPWHCSTNADKRCLGTCQLRSPKRIGLLFLSPRAMIGSDPRLSRTAKDDRAERRTTTADVSPDILSSSPTSSGVEGEKPRRF